jgi:hypothetical protein
VAGVLGRLQEGDFLVVTSDHGMLENGNHGGHSTLETNTFAYMYSKGGLLEGDGAIINQTDLTSLLAYLLNVPLPSNNVGIPPPVLSCPDYREYRATLASQPVLPPPSQANTLLPIATQALLLLLGTRLKAPCLLLLGAGAAAALCLKTSTSLALLAALALILCLALQPALTLEQAKLVAASSPGAVLFFSYFLLLNEDSFKALLLLGAVLLQGGVTAAEKAALVLLVLAFINQHAPNNAHSEFEDNLLDLRLAWAGRAVLLGADLVRAWRNREHYSLLSQGLHALCAGCALGGVQGWPRRALFLAAAGGLAWEWAGGRPARQLAKAALGLLGGRLGYLQYAFLQGLEGHCWLVRLLGGELALLRLGVRHSVSTFDVTRGYFLSQEFHPLLTGAFMGLYLLGPFLYLIESRDRQAVYFRAGVEVLILATVTWYNEDKILFTVIYAEYLILLTARWAVLALFACLV